MPIFHKKLTKEQKKSLEKKLLVAQEKPDSVFDLADCGITKVPDGVFAKCRVLQKQALLLQHNLLEDLKNGGNFNDLSSLLVLDLSYNHLSTMPKSFKVLTKLQKLDVSHNKLKKLPEEIGCLKDLQVLNVSDNQLSGLPSTIKDLRNIVSLDISENKYLTNLPANLCFLQHLTDFKCDWDKITYPVKEITSKGIGEIQRWFRKLKGEEFLLDDDKTDGSAVSSPAHTCNADVEDEAFKDAILERERQKELLYKDRLRLEQEILDSQTENVKLLVNAQHQRQQVLTQIEKNEIEAQTALVRQFGEENEERNKLLQQLYLEENHLDETVNLVLQMSERARHTEEILEELEQEQLRMDQLVKITQEETEKLRKQEIIELMSYVLNELHQSQQRWLEYEHNRDETCKQSLQSTENENAGLAQILHEKEETQHELVQKIMTEEQKQKVAFQLLQFQKDSKLNRIKKQVDMIEAELARLSLLEMQKREERSEQEMNTLSEMRMNTAVLLSQLMGEKEKREQRLKETMNDMEQKREDDAKDYWLIQFQRLLDTKPQILVDAENRLDIFIVEILLHAHAKEYLPHFARHKVNENSMRSMTDDRLKEIGVKDEAVRQKILEALKAEFLMNAKMLKKEETFIKTETPTSAKEVGPMSSAMPTAPTSTVNACLESECVVCMDRKPEVVFLTCGHVCTCGMCCQPLVECPLCRQKIVQKCRLFGV